MTPRFQTVVVGAGALGAATAYWLTERGQTDVLVLERFELTHDLGSSTDHHRIIRHSYHDDAYGRLTRAMYDNWHRLERAAGQRVFVQTGGLDVAVEGSPGAGSVDLYRHVMDLNGVPWEALYRDRLLERFPQWAVEEDVRATFQAEAGFIDIRRAKATHLALARAAGATVRDRTPVRSIESVDGGVRVVTDDETFTAAKVVVCGGSWTDELLAPLGQTWRTTITEEQVAYVEPLDLGAFALGTFPIWVWHGEDQFYGFPTYGEVGIKLARENLRRVVTQETRSRAPHPEETEVLLAFLRERLPSAAGRLLRAATCPYDMTPDRGFVLDTLPGHPDVVVGSGAAHAGKFCGLIGEVLSDLVVRGTTDHDVSAFRADRPALADPAHRPVFSLKG